MQLTLSTYKMRAAKAGPPGEIVKGNENSSMPVNFAAEQKGGSKTCEGAAQKRNAKAQGRGQISIAKSAWTRASTRTSLTAAANAVSSSLKHKASKHKQSGAAQAHCGRTRDVRSAAGLTSALVELFERHQRWLQRLSHGYRQHAAACLQNP